MISRIRSEKQYSLVMKSIDGLLTKATEKGGFHKLDKDQTAMLTSLSKLTESYEDDVRKIMPLKPRTLKEAVEHKMVERKLTQAKLAKTLGIGAPKLSQILSGKRDPDVIFLKAVHKKLHIDATFLLNHA